MARSPKPAPAVDRASLEAAALAYLERYASSAENLRRVLVRRIRRAAHLDDTVDADAALIHVDALVERYTSARLVDDDAYARGRAASLSRRGESLRGIRAKLQAKGVGQGEVRTALDALTEGSSEADVELASAWKIARKRRLGPFRDEAQRAERRDKDIAALMRRGFGYGVAARVIRAHPDEAPQ